MTTTGFAASAYSAAQNMMGGARAPSTSTGGAPAGLDFGALLRNTVEGVAQSGRAAETQVVAAASGKADLVDVVTAVAESETALQTLVSVRDRMISAYEEIMRMQI